MENSSPKIVTFLCTWCSYAGADLAGTGRNQYPPNIRVIRVPCSGRINPMYIIKALLEDADGVMVSGCHPGDCHYLVGNYFARRRFVVLKKLLTTAGFDANRINFTWVSASEGARFADVVKEVTEKVVGCLGYSKSGKLGDGCSKEPVIAGSIRYPLDNADFTGLRLGGRNDEFEHDLISVCRKLLDDGTVSSVIGYQNGGDMGLSVPCIIDSPDNVDKLVWNSRCVPNLSGYLLQRQGKAAVVAKPCDARAVVSLIKENQLKREDVYIIGLACDGMADDKSNLLPACSDCTVRIPPLYDVLVGDDKSGKLGDEARQGDGSSVLSEATCDNVFKSVDKTDEPSPCLADNLLDKTFERFVDEMNKCILCYSCRQSCYGCYCKTCFMERGEPDWQTASPDIGAKMLYHLGRTTHLSGRCVECGACENACASGVNIRYLIQAVTEFIKDTYNYEAGIDLETEPAMLTYKVDDEEIGFL